MANMTKKQQIQSRKDVDTLSNQPRQDELAVADTGFSVIGLLRRLPNFVMIPGLIGLFALLLTDLAVADPVPFLDEAAIFYLFASGLKVMGERKKARKALAQAEPESVADVYPEPTTSREQPMSVPSV